jgi:tetratricopeptide (TPR) repeat protein
VETELARVQGSRRPSAFGALFGGGGATTTQLATLEELQRRYPNNAQISNALGRARRIGGDLDLADSTFDLAIRQAPQAPEGYFGMGTVARARGDRPRATELLNVALERNGAFFPSRYELAAMAEEQGDFVAAVEQRRRLYNQRQSEASAIALAQTLRLSGAAGFAEAEQVLIPLSTSNPSAAIELARLYNDAGRPDAAIGAYQNALRVDADSSVAAFELGETLAAQGSYAEAERMLRQAVRADASNVPLEDPQQAEREYRQALNEGVDDPVELAKIGEAALATGNFGQAIDAFDGAVTIDPNNALYHHRLAQAYFRANRLEQAAEQANIALSLASDPQLQAESLVVLADVARLSGDLPGATNNYIQALQLSPGLIPAELGLGLVAVGQGNWGVAGGYFQSAAAMPGGADDPLTQFWLAEARLRQGDYVGATTAYSRAIALQPTFPAAYLGLAQVRYAQGDIGGALTTVETAVGQEPDFAEALLFKGKLLQELGRTNEALSAYSASISANGQIAESHYRRGMIELQNSRYDNAVRDFRRATALQPNFPEAFYWLGRAYYAEGRLDPALQALQQAVALNGNYLEALFYTGLVYEDLGRTAEAVSAFQTVIAIEPTNPLAAEARVNIDRLT